MTVKRAKEMMLFNLFSLLRRTRCGVLLALLPLVFFILPCAHTSGEGSKFDVNTRTAEDVNQFKKLETQLTVTTEKATYQALLQEFNLAKEAYSAVQKQTEQARMAQSIQQDKQCLTLIDNPDIPVKPFKPNLTMLALAGLFSGFFLGIAAAMTVDHFDHRMKNVYGIEKHLNIPVLGSIPSL